MDTLNTWYNNLCTPAVTAYFPPLQASWHFSGWTKRNFQITTLLFCNPDSKLCVGTLQNVVRGNEGDSFDITVNKILCMWQCGIRPCSHFVRLERTFSQIISFESSLLVDCDIWCLIKEQSKFVQPYHFTPIVQLHMLHRSTELNTLDVSLLDLFGSGVALWHVMLTIMTGFHCLLRSSCSNSNKSVKKCLWNRCC